MGEGSGKESGFVSGCSGAPGTVAPARGQEVEESVWRMRGVYNDVLGLLSGPSSVQVLEGGQGGTNDFFSCPNLL